MTSTLPTHPVLRHPLTGAPVRAIGVTRRGRLIWPVMGGSDAAGEPAAPPTDTAPAPSVPAAASAVDPEPAAAPQQAAVPSPPVTPANPPAATVAGGEHGFPENTPLSQMTAEQQAAYWRYHARKWEARANATKDYEQVKKQLADLQAATMTEQQRAIAEAEERGRRAALAEAGSALVEQFMRAALAGRKTEAEITALIGPLDRNYFLSADGLSVDTGKVTAWAESVAPSTPATAPAAPPAPAAPLAGQSTPAAGQPGTGSLARPLDMGQGVRTTPKPSGLAAGAAIARERFGLNKPAQ